MRVISGDLAQLPLVVYRRTEDGREPARDHPAYPLLRRAPNPQMHAANFIEMLTHHALGWGAGRAVILRDARGDPVSLVPLLPDRTWTESVDGQLVHVTLLGESREPRAFNDQDVLCVLGLGFDGVNAYSVVTMARNAIGLALAEEKHGARTFRHGAVPRVVLETPQKLRPEEAEKLMRDWNAVHAGVENAAKTAVLHAGLTVKPLSISPVDAQWLEGRAFQRVEIAGWFNLPPHKLGDSARTSYASLEQENLAYLQSCLGYWMAKWEAECYRKLLRAREQVEETHYVEFNTAKLLRADMQARYAAYAIGISHEFLSPDEVRERENLNRRPDGQGGVYRNPNTRSDRTAQEK
jgi:HK97 family phage portal protein